MPSFNTIFLSLLGGILPALLWLWFWLKEDKKHPEPKWKIGITFLFGMISVILVLPVERFIFNSIFNSSLSLLVIFLWATTEELFKYLAAYWSALRGKEVDEPIDPVIYMITAALGFSALENTLFIFNIIDTGFWAQSILTGNSRFLGATLLHIASSSIIGVMMGLSFYKNKLIKRFFVLIGICAAILLHTIFNLFIIKLESNIFFVFAGVWILIIVLIVLFEKLKSIRK